VKATKETLSPTRVKLTVEVPFEELKPSLDAAYRKLAKEVRVAGFRPGKVPPRILDQRLGRGVVLEQALQEAVPHFYSEAVEAEEIVVISGPDLDIADFADGAPLVFTAEMDVRPTIALPALDSLEVTVDATAVTDEQVDAELDKMRDQSAVLEPVDRPVRAGDYVSLDMAAAVDGDQVEGADAAGLSYEVGSGNLVDGIDESIIGAVEGESRTFDTKLLAGDRAGQTAEVTVTVRGVKEKKRPELDDDFVTTASEFDTVADLRADIRGRLEEGRRVQQVQQARDRLIDLLVEQADVPVPESVLAGEIEAREQRFSRELERMGVESRGLFRERG
jgi:trigger factor